MQKPMFLQHIRGGVSVLTADIEATCNAGPNQGAHIDYMLCSEAARPYAHTISPVVNAPWRTHI
eukprot:6483679-Pyramimonas_sp.AAC.1